MPDPSLTPRIRRIEVDDEIAEALLHAGFPMAFMRLDPLDNGRLLMHFNHHAYRAALAKAEAEDDDA